MSVSDIKQARASLAKAEDWTYRALPADQHDLVSSAFRELANLLEEELEVASGARPRANPGNGGETELASERQVKKKARR